MCLYLTKRGGTYYFRRSIPDDLQPAFNGAGEFMFSLRTKEREEAKRKRDAEALRTTRELDEARAGLTATGCSEAVSAAPARAITPFEVEQAEDAGRQASAQDARREELSDYIEFLRRRLRGSTTEMPRELRAFRYILEGHEFDARLLKDQLTIARAEKRELEAPLAEPGHSPPSPASGNVPLSAPVSSDGAEQGAMLDTTVVDLWSAERKVVKKGIDTHRAVASWFYDRVGRKPVDQIARKDVLAFKTKLVEEGQSAANIKMKLSRLRTLLQWAFVNDYASHNAAQGVEIKDTEAAKNKRKPFDIGSLNAIFSSAVYADNSRPTQGRGEAAYWLPLLALFTGARLEELGQLRSMDVQLEHYPDDQGRDRVAWSIHIREDAEDDLRLKNAASERMVPVHPELERLGFIRFVEAAKAAKQARLFPLLKPNIYGRLTAKWGEWWSGYRRTVCGITDRRLVFHSFRHTFKDFARHAGVIEGVQRQIMGHSPGDVADEYGSGYSLHQLVEGMRLYRIPGLRAPAPPQLSQ